MGAFWSDVLRIDKIPMRVGIDVFAQCQQIFFEISVFKRSNISINDTANW